MDLETILKTIISRSLNSVHAEQGLITLVSPDPADPTEKTLVHGAASSADQHPLRLANDMCSLMPEVWY